MQLDPTTEEHTIEEAGTAQPAADIVVSRVPHNVITHADAASTTETSYDLSRSDEATEVPAHANCDQNALLDNKRNVEPGLTESQVHSPRSDISVATAGKVNDGRDEVLSSPHCETSPLSKPSSSPANAVPYDQEEPVIRLLPTSMEQCKDFSALLQRAKQLGADSAGVFKFLIPRDLGKLCKIFTKTEDGVSTYEIHHQRQELPCIYWMTDRRSVRMELPQPDHNDTVEELTAQFEEHLQSPSGLKDVRYRIDVEAKQPEDREHAGLPQDSPIWPTKENQLCRTKSEIPGLHSPYAYKSDTTFGAPFTCHKEDFDLIAANVLYYGKKIWTVTAPSDAFSLETKILASIGHDYTCAQGVRHCSTYIPQSKLREWKISNSVFSQVANEVVVVLPNAYHQGFSTGSTLAEAINYAPTGWSIHSYSECLKNCPGTPIPNAMMEFCDDSDSQKDECSDAEQMHKSLTHNQKRGAHIAS